MGEVTRFIPRLGGKLAVAYAVNRLSEGSLTSWNPSSPSPTAGSQWSIKQYAVAALVAQFGGRLLKKVIGSTNVSQFRQGAWDLILTKLVWTEGLGRSDWARQQFGADGDVRYNQGTGMMQIEQGGRWNDMQGTLVEASPMDGVLVEKSQLDGPEDYEYGHLMSDNDRQSQFVGSGYKDPIHAAYSYQT